MHIRNLWKQSIGAAFFAALVANFTLPAQGSAQLPVPRAKPEFIMWKSFNDSPVSRDSIVSGDLAVPVPLKKPNPDMASLVHEESKIVKTATVKTVIDDGAFKGFKSSVLKLIDLSNSKNLDPMRSEQDEIDWKKPLSASNSAIYKEIFRLQALGKMKEADKKIAELTDKRLRGYYLYQRYIHPDAYRSKYEELRKWLADYSDYSGADKIYRLAKIRAGDGKRANNIAALPAVMSGKPVPRVHEPTIYVEKKYISSAKITSVQARQVKAAKRKVLSLVRSKKLAQAIDEFRRNGAVNNIMDQVERDRLQAQIALGYLYAGQADYAQKLAFGSSDRSGKYVPLAAWVGGLTLWQENNFGKAAAYFERAGGSQYASGWLRSAGYYWAARAYFRSGDSVSAKTLLVKAAIHGRTFYGLLARQSLGQDFGFNWSEVAFTQNDKDRLLATDTGLRAASLVAAGQYDMASNELMRLDYSGNAAMRHAALAYASHVGLPDLSMRLGNIVKAPQGGHYDSALYPLMPWEPKGGYNIDPALIHAIVRQESRFQAQASSYSGAIGLMQIMPRTARHVLGAGYSDRRIRGLLSIPDENLAIGQKYLQELLKDKNVNGDILSMLVAYNAGPGNLARWKRNFGRIDDPLLFIEMIPVSETRNYVKRVLSNYWIYKMRSSQEVPSLVSMAKGELPRYAHVMQMSSSYKVAANR